MVNWLKFLFREDRKAYDMQPVNYTLVKPSILKNWIKGDKIEHRNRYTPDYEKIKIQ